MIKTGGRRNQMSGDKFVLTDNEWLLTLLSVVGDKNLGKGKGKEEIGGG